MFSMMTHPVFFFLGTVLILLSSGRLNARPTSDKAGQICEGLVAYRLTLVTYWSRTNFPKQYPMYRPPAQWSKLFGQTHSSEYKLWSEGDLVSEAVRQFAEKAISTQLENQAQGMFGIFDAFVAPNIETGEGTTKVNIYANSKHSKLSTIVRMIPSPDWFIGVNSLDLCDSSSGRWTTEKSVDLHPMDAGTDRGLTFTSPDWMETPPKVVTMITSRLPSHPAGSFHYPELNNLTAIARLTVTKINFDDVIIKEENTRLTREENSSVELTPIPVRLNERLPGSYKLPITGNDSSESDVNQVTLTDFSSAKESKQLHQRHHQKALRNAVVSKRGATNGGRPLSAATSVRGPPVDCEVTGWSDWSGCSKTCGFGERTRVRSVVRAPQSGGRACPPLKEDGLCGTMRSCDWRHFSQTNWDTNASGTGTGIGTGSHSGRHNGTGVAAKQHIESRQIVTSEDD